MTASNSIRIWQIQQQSNREIQLTDQSSLDAITRQLPAGFYTTFRTYAKATRAIGLDSHLQRLYQPAITTPVAKSYLRKQLANLLRDYPQEARLRVIMTHKGLVFILIEPLRHLPTEVYEHGVCVVTLEKNRDRPRLKSTGFIERTLRERQKILEQGIFEALLIQRTQILEGLTSNFFYVKHGRLGTAQRDILLGVTRRIVLRLAREMGVGIIFQTLRLDAIGLTQEAFITSSSRGIVPVVQIDDIKVGQGSPGRITRNLFQAYESYVDGKSQLI
jgi:branched-chain amino acid aminotransferase